MIYFIEVWKGRFSGITYYNTVADEEDLKAALKGTVLSGSKVIAVWKIKLKTF